MLILIVGNNMDYDKNTIIAFVLIFLVLIGYWMFNAPQVEEGIVENPINTTNNDTLAKPLSKIEPEKVAVVPSQKLPEQKKVIVDQHTENKTFIVDTSQVASDVVIENDLFRSIISSKGACIRSWRLKKYAKPNSIKDNGIISPADWVEIIGPNANFKNYFGHDLSENYSDYNYANLAIYLPTQYGDGDTSPLSFSISNEKKHIVLNKKNPVDSLVYFLDFTNGGTLKKIYTFYADEYHFDLRIELTNVNDILSRSFYKLEWRSGLSPTEDNIPDDMNYAKSYVLMGKEFEKNDIPDEDEEVKPITGKIGWIGASTKYFGLSIIPSFIKDEKYALIDALVDGEEIIFNDDSENTWKKYSIELKIPTFTDDYRISHQYQVFLGPLDYFLLEKYDKKLEEMVDLGSYLRPIGVGILYAFTTLHGFINNYGLVIIIFSILIKLILFPLTKKSYTSMKKMQELQPALNELKDKHKDPKKLQKAQMALYKEKGVNPVGGCLPMILQMPLLFALYWVFRNTIELRGEPFIWWITDLSMPDTIFTLPFNIPMYGNKFNILPILMGVSMLFQQKMTMKDPKQKMMVYMMPVFMILIFNKLSSGLNLYYTLFNFLSMAQQRFSKTDDKEETPAIKENPKKVIAAKSGDQRAKKMTKKRKK